MATSGSCETSKYNNKKWVAFNWIRESVVNNASACRSGIYFEIKGVGTDSSWHYAGPINVWINRTSADGYPDFTFWANRGQLYNDTLVGSGRFNIDHYTDGSGEFSVYIEAAIYNNAVNCYGSGYWQLDSLPRYANFTEHYVSATGLNSISVHWNADAACDWVQYSLNGGAWTDTSGLDYTIYGLQPNTYYNIRTRIRRADSQLWTESGYIYGTTKDIARITTANNFNLGDSETVSFSNPSGAAIEVGMYKTDGATPIRSYQSASGSSYTLNFTDAELDSLYKMFEYNTITVRIYLRTTANNLSYWDYKTVTITLTGNQKTGHINVSGTWKRSKKWANVNGTWKRCVRWININGTWKRCI